MSEVGMLRAVRILKMSMFGSKTTDLGLRTSDYRPSSGNRVNGTNRTGMTVRVTREPSSCFVATTSRCTS